MPQNDEVVWSGKALCAVKPDRPEFETGARGAWVVVVCRAESASAAAGLIDGELAEVGLDVRGFDYLFDVSYMDREISEYERTLVSRLESHPVQFESVHFFKPDG